MAYSPVPTAGSSLKAWWASAVVYQVYPRSFADANGDGMGDIRGVTAHLDHLHTLGVDAVWLSPFYKSPQADAGYDVADYREVDPLFGTLADFDEMLQKAHGLGLKVIVDLVPNHTSDEHAWFRQALAAPPGSRERDRYMFRPGKDSVPGSGDGDLAPNNWKSIFGGPAWTRVTGAGGAPGEWYLHLFDTKQPDLNWENAEVKEEMRSVLRFWLDRGVDGFRVDVAHGMVKEAGLPDWEGSAAMVEGATELPGDAHGGHTEAEEPHRAHTAAAGSTAAATTGADAAVTATTAGDGDGHQPVSPLYPPSPFFDQDGVHDIYRDWNRVLADYDGDRMLVAEAWVEPAERLARYVRPDEMQQAFNFDFLLAGWDAARTATAIEDSLRAAATVGATTTWVLSNHDTVRHTTRFGLKDPTTFPKGIAAEDEQPDAGLGLARARAATMVSLALPGSAYLYQGEELGLPEHTAVPAEARQDPTFFRTNGVERGRDGCRVPLPWKSGEPGYGFASASGAGTGAANAPAAPWLPQPESFGVLAADRQDGVAGSTLELYRAALALRREHRLGAGSFIWADAHGPADGVLAFRNGDVLVIANMGIAAAPLPDGYRVALASTPEAVTGGNAESGTDLAGARKLAPNSAAYLLAD